MNEILNFFFYITPLHLAIDAGNIEIVKSLLTHKDIDLNATLVFYSFFSLCNCIIINLMIFLFKIFQ